MIVVLHRNFLFKNVVTQAPGGCSRSAVTCYKSACQTLLHVTVGLNTVVTWSIISLVRPTYDNGEGENDVIITPKTPSCVPTRNISSTKARKTRTLIREIVELRSLLEYTFHFSFSRIYSLLYFNETVQTQGDFSQVRNKIMIMNAEWWSLWENAVAQHLRYKMSSVLLSSSFFKQNSLKFMDKEVRSPCCWNDLSFSCKKTAIN